MNLLTTKTFFKVKFIIIFFVLLHSLFSTEILASRKRRVISDVEVKVYKKERKHIEISALLCALALNGKSVEDIRKTLEVNFQKPISRSDHFLIVDIMEAICPEFDNKKLFEEK